MSKSYIRGYMNRKQLAEHFGVHTSTIYRWLTKGCPSHKLATGKVVYNLEEVEKWMLEKGGKNNE